MTSDFAGLPYGSFGRLGPGRRIAGNLIEEQIGAGGMAVVFRARDEVLGRLAAIKVIAPSLASDEEFRARFLRESRAVAAVHSLHIIPVYTAGEAEGLLYIATRFVPGGDLAMLVRRSGGRLAAGRVVSLVTQVASALDAAHAAGLVHRDVKPQNILVDTVPERPEHAYLSDFGLSKGVQSSAGLTASGQFMGTPDYCAPEQIRGGHMDGRADQYALACVAFVLLTGTLPFRRPEAVAAMFAHLQDPVPLVTGLRPELPVAVDGVIARALAKSPEQRYGQCGDFAAALQEVLVPARSATVLDGGPSDGLLVSGGQEARQKVLASSMQSTPVSSARPSGPQGTGPVSQASAADGRAAQENLGYASTITGGIGGTSDTPAAAATAGSGGQPRRPHRRTALIGGTVALALAVAGIVYAVQLPGSSLRQPSKPTLAATLTVPGGATAGYANFSPDGRLIAAASTSKIYIWDAKSRTYLTTLTAPDIAIGTTTYQPTLESFAFSTDDSSLTAAVGPVSAKGKPLPSSILYVFYRWDLATGKRTTIGSISAPSRDAVVFSGDSGTAFITVSSADVRVATPGHAGHVIFLPGTIGAFPVSDGNGGRIIYDNVSQPKDVTYVLDVNKDKVIDKLNIDSYLTASSYLSPNGGTAAVSPVDSAWNSPAATARPWELWDVITNSNISPADPRWRQQQLWADPTFSTDSSIVATGRAGGKTDLWNVATGRYLLTISDPDYREDGYVEAVGPGGSEVVIAASVVGKASASTTSRFRQLRLWLTPLSPS